MMVTMLARKKIKWNSTIALTGQIKVAIDAKKFDGHNGAIAQANRLSPQFLSGDPNPDLLIKKMRMSAYSSASRFFYSKIKKNPLLFVCYPRAVWYKYQARRLAKDIMNSTRLNVVV